MFRAQHSANVAVLFLSISSFWVEKTWGIFILYAVYVIFLCVWLKPSVPFFIKSLYSHMFGDRIAFLPSLWHHTYSLILCLWIKLFLLKFKRFAKYIFLWLCTVLLPFQISQCAWWYGRCSLAGSKCAIKECKCMEWCTWSSHYWSTPAEVILLENWRMCCYWKWAPCLEE